MIHAQGHFEAPQSSRPFVREILNNPFKTTLLSPRPAPKPEPSVNRDEDFPHTMEALLDMIYSQTGMDFDELWHRQSL